MNKDFFVNNRNKLFDKMEDGSLLFLHSGIAPVKSHDQSMHPFAVNRDFYYLTGIEEQDVWLVLGKSPMGTPSEALFIEQPDEEIIKWNGKMLTVERACELSGMEQGDIKYKQDMERFVARKLSREADKALFSFDRLSMGAFRTPSEDYALKLREKYPALPIENAFKMISGLRAIKTPEEIEGEFAGKGYGDFKGAVGEVCADSLAPVQAEYARLMADKAYLEDVMTKGAMESARSAARTMSKVRRKIGFTEPRRI